MYNFFAEKNSRNKDCYFISGSDYNHIKNVLRMNIGDTFLISDEGKSHLCEIDKFEGECVIARVIQENYQDTNLPAKIYLFQGLPKSDKLELIIQKEGCAAQDASDMFLFPAKESTALNIKYTLKENGVETGDKLLLI